MKYKNEKNQIVTFSKTVSFTVLLEGSKKNQLIPLDLQRSAELDKPVLDRDLRGPVAGFIRSLFNDQGIEVGLVMLDDESIVWDPEQLLVSIETRIPVNSLPDPDKLAKAIKNLEYSAPSPIVSIWVDKVILQAPKGLEEEGIEWTLFTRDGEWRDGFKPSAYKRITYDVSKFMPNKDVLEKAMKMAEARISKKK